jgi:phospholipid-binding lipoprotein MlaA
MSWVVACVLCTIGATGCGTLTRSHVDALAPDATAVAPAEPSVAATSSVAVSDESQPGVAVNAVRDAADPAGVSDVAGATEIADPVVTTSPTPPSDAGDTQAVASTDDRFADTVALLLQTAQQPSDDDAIPEEYDPWEKFNEKMFEFNRRLDRYLLKPAATAYDKVVPDRVQSMVANGFDNIRWLPRFMNSLLQAKWNGASRELGRFLINSTLGIGGLFDIAKQEFGIEKSREDFGQTLGVWGAGPGPFLVLPLLPPLTVRDAVGFVVDGAMNPLNYVLPFIPDRFFMAAGDAINDRSLNLELYQGFEETVIDMYSAVRHGYLQRREQLIKE